MSRKYPHALKRSSEPARCWVGEQAKVCYATRLEAEAAALVAEHDYGAPRLSVYRCPYGNHYHLSSARATNLKRSRRQPPVAGE